jgi:hypothetical protein
MPGMKWIKKTVVSPAWAVFKFSTINARTAVLIDSGCTKLVFHNSDKLINLCKPEHNYVIHRVGRKLPVTLVMQMALCMCASSRNALSPLTHQQICWLQGTFEMLALAYTSLLCKEKASTSLSLMKGIRSWFST